jgi:hypothetical protein
VALFARYGDPGDPFAKTATDMFWEFRVERGIRGGEEFDEYVTAATGVASLTDATATFWELLASTPVGLDGGGVAVPSGYWADGGVAGSVVWLETWDGGGS